jgi:hypothetical protein
MQNPPNDGALQLVGNLESKFWRSRRYGYYSYFAVTNSNSISSLFTIDLMTGT